MHSTSYYRLDASLHDGAVTADDAGPVYDRIVSALIRKLDSADPRAALAAEQDLLAVGMPANPVLIFALAECGWPVRARIARVLGKLGCTGAISELLAISVQAQNHRSESWVGAHDFLDTVGDLLALPERDLWTRIDEPVYFRLQVICALYAIRGSAGISALCDLLDDTEREIQRFAVLAVRSLAEEEPSPALRAALPPLRRMAAGWPTSDRRARKECELAIKAIERVTVATEQFPLPAGPGEPDAWSLPRPHPLPVPEHDSPG